MKLILKNAHLKKSERMDSEVEYALNALAANVQIEEAEVHIEGRPEASPPFRVSVRLTIPGPDIHAEAMDYTPHTAFARVLTQLRSRITERGAKKQHHEKELRSLVHSPRGSTA